MRHLTTRPAAAASSLLLLLLASLTLGALAQTKDEPPPRGQLPPNWKKLGLSDEQVKKVYTLQADYDKKEAALKKQLADLKKEEAGKLLEVLTDAQKARLKELKDDKP